MIWLFLSKNLLRIRNIYWRLVYMGYRRRFNLHHNFRFNGPGIEFYGEGKIVVGSHSYIGSLSTVQASLGNDISIGSHCSISHNVRLYTQSAQSDSDFRLGDGTPVRGPIHIGDGVWIGANVYIGPGRTIEENAVVGANSVVTRDIPRDEIWAGTPARKIRSKRRNL